jgi:transposase-like protein
MREYSKEMKEAIVAKICRPGGFSYSQVARESGIAPSTVHGWVKSLGGQSQVKLVKKQVSDLSPAEKLKLIFDSMKLSETELGDFVRRNGIFASDLDNWKTELLLEVQQIKRGRPKLDPEVVKLREANARLQKDLRRKDKALAEASALVILKKRAEEIWGKDEEDE